MGQSFLLLLNNPMISFLPKCDKIACLYRVARQRCVRRGQAAAGVKAKEPCRKRDREPVQYTVQSGGGVIINKVAGTQHFFIAVHGVQTPQTVRSGGKGGVVSVHSGEAGQRVGDDSGLCLRGGGGRFGCNGCLLGLDLLQNGGDDGSA